MKFLPGTVRLEDPIVRIEAKAMTHDGDMVATVHFLGRFDPEQKNPSDHADPEVLDALLRASMALDKALHIIKDLILSKEVERAMKGRQALAKMREEVREQAEETKH